MNKYVDLKTSSARAASSIFDEAEFGSQLPMTATKRACTSPIQYTPKG
jgi:hypothetical protein